MPSIADGLPPEIAAQIHPDWRMNEAEYWRVRDQLLTQYQGEWIAYVQGRVVASGRSPVEVFHAAHDSGLHPFVICVGKEQELTRIRSDWTLNAGDISEEGLSSLADELFQALDAEEAKNAQS